MANRRFSVHETRDVIVRMRMGETDRQIAKDGLMGRSKASRLRSLANENGWLEPGADLPANDVIAELFQARRTQQRLNSLVEPYAAQVLRWAGQGVSGVAIHQCLVRDHGFTGAYNSVKRFLQAHRPGPSATIVLDFKPGEAAQVDFGSGPRLMDLVAGKEIKTWFFVMTLAFSRHQYLEFVLDQKVETWLGCHRRAFEFFGGVPRKAIIDNPKCAITRACYTDPEVQRAYAEYAEEYGFLISPCPVADAAKKGIVESGVKYVKANFLPLRTFRDLPDMNRQGREWVLETAGNRIHGTTKERPLHCFVGVEKAFLKQLPAVPPEIAAWERVKLHPDCHVNYDSRRYSAPHPLIGQYLWLRATETTVQIFHEESLVATHARQVGLGKRSTIEDHYPPNAQAYLMATPQWCLQQAEKVGEHCLELIEALFADKVLDKLRSAQGVIRMADKYGHKRLEAACARAVAHDTPTYVAVKSILTKGLDQEPARQAVPLGETYGGKARFIRGTFPLQ